MRYDEKFWDEYADANEARYSEEFAGFVSDLAAFRYCDSILEIGCGTGIDLRLCSDVEVYGADLNDHALDIARTKMPDAHFKKAGITDLPFEDSSIDLVFTHQLLNYLDDETLDIGMAEMYRVSRRYIMSYEKFGRYEEQIDKHHKSRNMRKRWGNYNVGIEDDLEISKVEPGSRFTLLKKL